MIDKFPLKGFGEGVGGGGERVGTLAWGKLPLCPPFLDKTLLVLSFNLLDMIFCCIAGIYFKDNLSLKAGTSQLFKYGIRGTTVFYFSL